MQDEFLCPVVERACRTGVAKRCIGKSLLGDDDERCRPAVRSATVRQDPCGPVRGYHPAKTPRLTAHLLLVNARGCHRRDGIGRENTLSGSVASALNMDARKFEQV